MGLRQAAHSDDLGDTRRFIVEQLGSLQPYPLRPAWRQVTGLVIRRSRRASSSLRTFWSARFVCGLSELICALSAVLISSAPCWWTTMWKGAPRPLRGLTTISSTPPRLAFGKIEIVPPAVRAR